MRKISFYLLTAATAMTAVGSIPATAYAATGTYNIPGGKMVVIGGSMNGINCDQNLPGINLPGIQFPGVNRPDNSFPIPEFPIPQLPVPEYPGNSRPDGMLPERPDGMLPEQPDGMLPERPDGMLPEQPDGMLPERPDGMLPEQPDGMLPERPDGMLPEQPDGMLPEQPDGSQDAFAVQVVDLVNEERARAGLPPLTIDNAAASAARTRSRELEETFSHTRPDGSSFNTALSDAGVNFRGAGENIAYGQSTPQQVMDGWMKSSGHRANILNADYTSIGVGHYRSTAGVDYWTQLFIQ